MDRSAVGVFLVMLATIGSASEQRWRMPELTTTVCQVTVIVGVTLILALKKINARKVYYGSVRQTERISLKDNELTGGYYLPLET